jgi:hypothetical protein
MDRWNGGGLTPSVEPGSSLAGDDAGTDPYQISHAITHLAAVAAEQLHAVKTLMFEAGVLHNSAPFTLARSSIEVAATALWMLKPPQGAERIRRRMVHAAQDAEDGTIMAEGAGIPVPREFSERKKQMEMLASKAAGAPVNLGSFRITRVVKAVDALNPSAVGILDAWRVGSGFAHGRSWSALGYLEREVLPAHEPGIAQLRLTNRADTVLWVTWAAYDLINAVLELFDRRARSPHG